MATITVFGGTGFLGSEIVRALVAQGFEARIATRHPLRLSPVESSDRTSHVVADVTDERSVRRAVEGAAGVVNAVSLYVEKGALTFRVVHVLGAECVARCARETGAEILVHISGIGTDPASASPFVRARARGEHEVREAFGGTVVMRPSLMFGRNDSFLAAIEQATRFPVVPLFGRGLTRLQPAYVRDVAGAVAKVIADPASRSSSFELGGAEVHTYRAIVEMVMEQLGRRRPLVPLPFAAWQAMTAALALMPSPPLTRDQVVLMQSDNVVSGRMATFADLGIRPAALSSLLRECLPGV